MLAHVLPAEEPASDGCYLSVVADLTQMLVPFRFSIISRNRSRHSSSHDLRSARRNAKVRSEFVYTGKPLILESTKIATFC